MSASFVSRSRSRKRASILGRGGPEHQYLQDLVKRWAESHGYRAVVEEEIPGGRGKVDVALRTDDFSLACEISVTSTVAQEVQNTLKCLEAGFHEVAILALKRPRLQKIEAALKATLPPSDLARVHLVSPEELFTMLSMRPVTKEKVVGGYKVRVRRTPVDSEEEAASSGTTRWIGRPPPPTGVLEEGERSYIYSRSGSGREPSTDKSQTARVRVVC